MNTFIYPDDGQRSYVVHFSTDPAYNKFCNWIDTITLVDSYDDFPRSYIELSEDDEAVMLDKFKEYIKDNYENI